SDVTKQYYDLESRMRAARTMEERLIDIIKKGKGEIKDLLLAERELGVWRTKLEEMEGEIRYYNNQVSLSTLTINLEEKEIRAAAAIVVTEHINMKIEADDVEKALRNTASSRTRSPWQRGTRGPVTSTSRTSAPPPRRSTSTCPRPSAKYSTSCWPAWATSCRGPTTGPRRARPPPTAKSAIN